MLPNWYGIGFEWRGSQCCTTRGNDIQDGLWENYQEDLETGYTSLEREEW